MKDRDPRGDSGFRGWINERADDLGVDAEKLLMGSKRRDPLYKGTKSDHKKAKWFANLWEKAVSQRSEDRIHIRGVHYFVVMAMDEDFGLNADAIRDYVDFNPRGLPSLSEEEVSPPTDCSWSRYENTERCFDYLKSAATLARVLGYVPLDGVFDNKHDQLTITRYGDHDREIDTEDVRVPTGISTPRLPDPDTVASRNFDAEEATPSEALAERIASNLVDEIDFDRPRQAPVHLELWCEKGLPDYIHETARSLGVNVVVEGEGDLSLTIAHEFAQRVNRAEKPAVVLYLSDFDPKGDQMASAMSSKMAYLRARGILEQRVCIDQLAVTQEQIERFGLPRKPIDASASADAGTGKKAYQTLVSEWEERKGAGATELNTLENFPELFEEIIREGCRPYTDTDLDTKNEEALAEWESEVRDRLVDEFQDVGLDDQAADLDEWLAAFNDRFEDAEPIIEDLRELKRDGYLSEWHDLIRDATGSTRIPLVEVPDGEGKLPDDPLYDSARDYLENVASVEQHERGLK